MLWLLLACNGEEKPFTEPIPEREAVEERTFPARIWRHTETQYRNTVFAKTGIVFEGELPVDYNLHGYIHVGAGEVTIAPYDLELYEQAAWSIAEQKIAEIESVHALVACSFESDPLSVLSGSEQWNTECIEQWIVELSEHFWSHSITYEERTDLSSMFVAVAEETNILLASQSVYASFLLSPHFLFRTEIGEYDEEGYLQLTGLELARRLSYFLTLSPPDDLLMIDALTGALTDDDILAFHARRLLDGESAREALTGFFHQTLDIERLYTMDKNTTLFPSDSPTLREAMVQELDELFWHAVETEDFRQLLTSTEAYINPELASIYDLATPSQSSWHTLPEEQKKRGSLGACWIFGSTSDLGTILSNS